MLMMEDGRIAVLPENGLPVGQFTATPKVDLAGLEVIVGPGAALYGADASSGVLTLQTKDPREFPGTTVEVTGGNRSYKDVQLRHAGVFGNWGYKVAGEYQDADDWSNQLKYGAAGIPEQGVGGEVDWTSRVSRGTGALVRYFGEGRMEVSGGMSRTDGVGQTNVGRNQLDGWLYNFVQARFESPRWYATAYRTQSKSGESYALNRFTENRVSPANAGKSDEEIRLMSDWPSDGQLYAAELQNNFTVPALLGTRFVWGVQGRRDVVSSDRQWLSDNLTGEDIAIQQYGVYAQTETPLLPSLQLLLAGRYDNHERYDAQWSPKAGLVFNPVEGQSLRVTYNRAFKSPTILQTDFFIPDFAVVTPTVRVGVYGNTEGFVVKSANGAETRYKPLVAEQNQTWEAGYKGVFRGRLFVDVTGYRSRYSDFLSPLTNIGYAYQNDRLVANAQGVPQLVFTYFNLGTAHLQGVDAGVNYVLNPKVDFAATYSLTDLRSVEGMDIKLTNGQPDTAKIRELSSLNAPERKWSLGANFRDLREWQGGLTMRHVGEYFFASGINKGTIPTFTTLDANVGYRFKSLNTTLTLGVSNLFSCRDADAAEPGDEDECGFGVEHREMVNMPRIGTMVFIGGRYTM
jgi:iron complex outermembrane receptor protein